MCKNCVDNHHTILKTSEDLKKALSKHVSALHTCDVEPVLDDGVMTTLTQLQRIARRLERKANVIARTQP